MSHPPLRSARSTTLLRKPLPTGFVNEEIPLPSNSIRRTKSSSNLTTAPTEAPPLPTTSAFQKALNEAQYLTAGLLSSPCESSRHYSVIRHSSALIWYRGPFTSVSITILSDTPLPHNRSIYLQQRGHSGNMGMEIKAFVAGTKSWIDITPQTQVHSHQIDVAEERNIQRDLKRFAKKASGRLNSHIPRETCLLRIPATCADGYFRVVICHGDETNKVLCGSPVFRVASTSSDVSILRGASLSTAPIEMGVKVATTIGTQVVKRYAGVAGAVIKSRAGKKVTHATLRKVGGKAYQSAGESWERSRAARYDAALARAALTDVALGPDDGPLAPFPMKFSGRAKDGIIVDAPDWVKSMNGIYAAWVGGETWREGLVTMAPLRDVPSVAMENAVAVDVLDEEVEVAGKVKVLLMARLRSELLEDEVERYAQDVVTTLSNLKRPHWCPEENLEKIRLLKSETTFSDRMAAKMMEQTDRMPLHWAGMRSEAALLRDQMYGNGGVWIQR